MLIAVVSHVEVVGRGGGLGAGGVDLLDKGGDAHRLARRAHGGLVAANVLCDLLVGEARLFRLQEGGCRQGVGVEFTQHVPDVGDALELPEEPRVDGRDRVDAVDAPAALERQRNREDATVVGDRQLALELLVVLVLGARRLEAADGRIGHAHRLLQRLLKGAPDGHHLADRLHGASDFA